VAYHDPHVPELSGGLTSQSFDELLQWAELAVIATAHPSVDHEAIVREVPLVVDLRGHTRRLHAANTSQL
jgi:UDP-N-acetyl-D-glucosamine dehydrogenase